MAFTHAPTSALHGLMMHERHEHRAGSRPSHLSTIWGGTAHSISSTVDALGGDHRGWRLVGCCMAAG